MGHRSWHIHMGAHKTATTHLQAQLAACRQELYTKRVFHLPHEDMREALMFRTVPRPMWWRATKLLRAPNPGSEFASTRFSLACAQRLQSQIDAMAGEATRVVLSEESFLGTTDQVFGGAYFTGPVRLALLRSLSESVPLHLYLSTRSLDSFLPSAYAQALRSFPASRLNFSSHLHRYAGGAPSWVNLVADIRKKVPNSQVTVWDYADYTENSNALLRLITGCDLDMKRTIPRPERTKSPSAKAIELAEQLPETDPRKRLGAVNAIYASHPAGNGALPFRPVPKYIRHRLREAYVRDLKQIAVMPGVTLVQFKPGTVES